MARLKRDPHPMQQIRYVGDVIRFRENKIVRFLLDNGGFDMNKLACMDFSDDDRSQFAQLIGYSVSGYGDLPYRNNEQLKMADDYVEELYDEKQLRTALRNSG